MGNRKGERRDFKALERRRYAAAGLFERDLTDSEIGRRLQVHRQSVGRWRQQWLSQGKSGLRGAGRSGRKSRLDEKQTQVVIEHLLKGPKACGFSSDVWTLARMAMMVEKVVGVKYHPRYLSEILARLGWSCQRPAMRAKERDEAAIRNWKARVWPRLKKKPKKSVES